MKRYYIYLSNHTMVGTLSPQLLAKCITDFERYDYPWMVKHLRALSADAKERARPDFPPVRRVCLNEVEAMLWGKAIGATASTRKALECVRNTQRHGLYLHWGTEPLPSTQTHCSECKRPL